MGEIVFVEILDRFGHVKERVRLTSFPATIGRAYTNDVIVDDRFVCPVHLRIRRDEDGGLVAEDAGSVNGTYTVSPEKKVARLAVSPNGKIRIGSTVIQFRSPDTHVASAEKIRGTRSFAGHPAFSFALFAAGYCLVLLLNGMESYEPFAASGFLTEALVLIILLVVWAGVWSFVNRLTHHSFRFLAHLAVAGFLLGVTALFNFAVEYADFLASPDPPVLYAMSFGGFALLGAVLLHAHLSVMGALGRVVRCLAALLVSSAIFGVIGFKTHDDYAGFSSAPVFSAEVKPARTSWQHAMTPEEFTRRTDGIKAKADREAGKAAADEAGEEAAAKPRHGTPEPPASR